MPDTGSQRSAPESDKHSVERRNGLRQFQANGRRALTGFDVRAVIEQPDAFMPRDGCRPGPCHLVIAVHQLQSRAQRADVIELDRRCKPGCHDCDLETPGATRPSQGLSEVARAATHHGGRAFVGKPARDYLGPASLEATDRVRRFELDAHGAAEVFQRLAAVQRRVEKNRVDHPTSRPDAGGVEARLLHNAAA